MIFLGSNYYTPSIIPMGSYQVKPRKGLSDGEMYSNCFIHTKVLHRQRQEKGETILFWKDMWNGKMLQLSYPQLHSYSNKENITLSEVLSQDTLHDLFNLLLSEEAYVVIRRGLCSIL
jgi:hypothetical protein